MRVRSSNRSKVAIWLKNRTNECTDKLSNDRTNGININWTGGYSEVSHCITSSKRMAVDERGAKVQAVRDVCFEQITITEPRSFVCCRYTNV